MARAFAQPQSLCVHVTLDDAPHYKGSIHEDAVARARGYKAALLPGAFVYGHVSRVRSVPGAWIGRKRGRCRCGFGGLSMIRMI